jgi:ribokinase
MVDATRENSIVVVPGANADLLDLADKERAAVTSADVLLLQLEVPLPTVAAAARLAPGSRRHSRAQRRTGGGT